MALAPQRNTTAGASLMSLVAKLNVQRYRHITNNAIDISPITISAYGKQQKCDMANNGIDISQITVSTYGKQRYRHMANNRSVISQTTVLAYAPYGIKRHRHTVLCFCAHKGLLQMRRNSNIRLQPDPIRPQPDLIHLWPDPIHF